MKLYDEPISVSTSPNQLPTRLQWRGGWHDVEAIQDRWRLRGRHWTCEESRSYYEISTADGIIMVICHRETTDTWLLVRLVD